MTNKSSRELDKPGAGTPELPTDASLHAEVARLTECLTRANGQTEEFERKWYLSCDEVESLRTERDALQAKVTKQAQGAQRDTRSAVVFGGRCVTHPLQVVPCQTCAAEAKLREQGICPDCEGAGEQGGQFCGGSWTCNSCEGTGKHSTKVDC
jgi:hypothetical protein